VKAGRVLDYLETLPFVDKDRFAFYGLSYGGFTALDWRRRDSFQGSCVQRLF